jgi:tetratricopeptide (TPR) repeat protein
LLKNRIALESSVPQHHAHTGLQFMKLSHLKTTPAATDPETVQARWICVFLALAVFAVFGQAAHFEFVNYDDAQNVYENPVVTKGLSVEAAGWAFTHAQLSSWVPLTTLSHMLDCQLFALDAGEHHLVNVVLHAANVVLLFLVVRQLTGSLWRSAFVAALFAFHPLRSESVAWVSERKDVLSGFFFLLSVGAYVRWVRQRSCAGHVGLVLLFALGLLAKSMVATLPFVLLLLDYWPLRRWGNANQVAGLVREKIPLFVLSAGACLAAVLAPGLLVTASRRLPLLERVGNAVVSYAVYVEQMFFPVGLATPYPIPSAGQPAWKIGLASLLLAGITTGAVAFRKSRPWLLTGWLWYLGMLFPVIGLLQISPDAAHADRYTYLPEIGLAIGATWALADWCGSLKRARATLGGLMIGVISGLCICGYVQTSYWHDDESLWLRALACTSGNYVAHYNLGNALVKHGELDEAVAQFQKSVEIQPDLFKPHYNLANALFKQGRFDDAIIQYRKALEIEPDNVEALNNLGNALAMTGADAKAIAEYQKAVALQPNYSDARCDLGHVLLKLGRLDEAVAQFQQAVAIKPDDPDLRNDLGKSLLMKNDFDGAMSCFEKTTPMSPDPLVRWRLVGDNFLKQEDWDAAIICYRQAISIDPHSANTCANLGMACFQKGEAREAIESWEKSLAINPDQLTVENNLAWLLATTSDPALRNGTRAVALAVQANESGGGGNPVILHTLAVAYAAQGSYGQAATTARRALQLALDQKRSALAATLQKEITDYETHPAPGSSRP